jgi:hypothetical protein
MGSVGFDGPAGCDGCEPSKAATLQCISHAGRDTAAWQVAEIGSSALTYPSNEPVARPLAYGGPRVRLQVQVRTGPPRKEERAFLPANDA